tara:strand:+ start:142 stop:324 length:183 start_codon:yes stop_codon:yes gene_type:complete
MGKYKKVESEIEVGDYFAAFGVIGKCTEVDKKHNPDEPNYNSKETKWTVGKHCDKIEFID